MTEFTAADLEELVDEEQVLVKYAWGKEAGEVHEIGGSEFWEAIHDGDGELAFPNIGEAHRVDSGGGMDEGSHIWTVFTVQDRHFRKNGYYASHYGTDWDGSLEEVEPFQRTITDYRTV